MVWSRAGCGTSAACAWLALDGRSAAPAKSVQAAGGGSFGRSTQQQRASGIPLKSSSIAFTHYGSESPLGIQQLKYRKQ